jgi:phosphoglycolate phosphatase
VRRCFQAIVFDFDYALADSSRGVIVCIDFALEEMGLPAVSAEAAKRTIGLSLADGVRMLAGSQHAARAGEFARLFVERADEVSSCRSAAGTPKGNAQGHSSVMADLTVLFESVPATIAALRARGFPLGIVSTKFRYRIEAILARDGLRGAFDVIIGGEDVAEHKPDPTGLLAAIERLGGVPESALYVGDSVIDAETAERAGMPFVAVLSGVTPREAFLDHPACGILESLAELLSTSMHKSVPTSFLPRRPELNLRAERTKPFGLNSTPIRLDLAPQGLGPFSAGTLSPRPKDETRNELTADCT